MAWQTYALSASCACTKLWCAGIHRFKCWATAQKFLGMKVCRDVEEWIKENIEREVEQQERRCV